MLTSVPAFTVWAGAAQTAPPCGKPRRNAMGALALQSELLSSHGFRHGFSLRHGGVSPPPFDSLNLGRLVGDDAAAVEENHRRLADAVGYERLYELSQVHGASTFVARRED